MPVTPRRLLLLIAPVVALMALAAVIGHAALFVVYPLVLVPLAVFVLTTNARLGAAPPSAAQQPSSRAAAQALPAWPHPRRAAIILAGGLVVFYALVHLALPLVAALAVLWLPVVAHRAGAIPGATAYSLLGADRLSARRRRAVLVLGYVFIVLVAAELVFPVLSPWA